MNIQEATIITNFIKKHATQKDNYYLVDKKIVESFKKELADPILDDNDLEDFNKTLKQIRKENGGYQGMIKKMNKRNFTGINIQSK